MESRQRLELTAHGATNNYGNIQMAVDLMVIPRSFSSSRVSVKRMSLQKPS